MLYSASDLGGFWGWAFVLRVCGLALLVCLVLVGCRGFDFVYLFYLFGWVTRTMGFYCLVYVVIV